MAWEGGRGDIGVSPLSYLGNTLRVEDATQRHQAASFENGVRSSGAFVIPADQRTKKEERDELRAHIAQRYSGVDNAGKPLLLFNGATWQDTQQTAVEAELIEQRKLNREEVAAAYKIPPPMIGILDKATYSNIETQKDMFYGMVLGPWLTLGEETLQAQLIEDEWPGEGLFVEYDLKEVLRGDPLKEAQAVQRRSRVGTMTPNEGCRSATSRLRISPAWTPTTCRRTTCSPSAATTDATAPPPSKDRQATSKRAADRLPRQGRR
jgi:HK97 family phage portal protein